MKLRQVLRAPAAGGSAAARRLADQPFRLSLPDPFPAASTSQCAEARKKADGSLACDWRWSSTRVNSV
jgi:hypothetical protein